MTRRPPVSTRTDTLSPSSTLFRSTTAKNIAPRVASLLDVMQISDILSVEGADSFTRPIYAGNAIATVTTSDTKLVLTVRTTAFDKASPEGDRKSTRLNSSH